MPAISGSYNNHVEYAFDLCQTWMGLERRADQMFGTGVGYQKYNRVVVGRS